MKSKLACSHRQNDQFEASSRCWIGFDHSSVHSLIGWTGLHVHTVFTSPDALLIANGQACHMISCVFCMFYWTIVFLVCVSCFMYVCLLFDFFKISWFIARLTYFTSSDFKHCLPLHAFAHSVWQLFDSSSKMCNFCFAQHWKNTMRSQNTVS